MNKNETGILITKKLKKVMFLIKHSIDDEFKKLNLTEPQGMLIRCLAHNGDMRVSDLSKKLDLSNSTVSGIVDRLVKTGILQRKRSESDRRVVIISLCEGYKHTAKDNFKKIENKLGKIMSEGSDDDLQMILNALEKLQNLLLKNIENKGEKKCSS